MDDIDDIATIYTAEVMQLILNDINTFVEAAELIRNGEILTVESPIYSKMKKRVEDWDSFTGGMIYQ